MSDMMHGSLSQAISDDNDVTVFGKRGGPAAVKCPYAGWHGGWPTEATQWSYRGHKSLPDEAGCGATIWALRTSYKLPEDRIDQMALGHSGHSRTSTAYCKAWQGKGSKETHSVCSLKIKILQFNYLFICYRKSWLKIGELHGFIRF